MRKVILSALAFLLIFLISCSPKEKTINGNNIYKPLLIMLNNVHWSILGNCGDDYVLYVHQITLNKIKDKIIEYSEKKQDKKLYEIFFAKTEKPYNLNKMSSQEMLVRLINYYIIKHSPGMPISIVKETNIEIHKTEKKADYIEVSYTISIELANKKIFKTVTQHVKKENGKYKVLLLVDVKPLFERFYRDIGEDLELDIFPEEVIKKKKNR